MAQLLRDWYVAVPVTHIAGAGHVADRLPRLDVARSPQAVRVGSAHAAKLSPAVTVVNLATKVDLPPQRAIGLYVTQTHPPQVVTVTPTALGSHRVATVDAAPCRIAFRADWSPGIDRTSAFEPAIMRRTQAACDGL